MPRSGPTWPFGLEDRSERNFTVNVAGAQDLIINGDTLEILGSGGISRYSLENGNYLSITTLNVNNANGIALCKKGDNVLVLDVTDLKVYGYTGSWAHRVADDYDLHEDNLNPVAIWSDGSIDYVLDSVKRQIFSYRAGKYYRDADVALDYSGTATGLWSSGRLWILTDDTGFNVFDLSGKPVSDKSLTVFWFDRNYR